MTQQSDSGSALRVEFQVHFRTGQRGRRHLRKGSRPKPPEPREDVPRLTRLLALAHRWNRLIEEGVVANQTAIAGMMGLTCARVTQIMDLLHLAPDIQECILCATSEDSSEIPERRIRSITRIPIWREQSKSWKEIVGEL